MASPTPQQKIKGRKEKDPKLHKKKLMVRCGRDPSNYSKLYLLYSSIKSVQKITDILDGQKLH